MSEYMEKHAVRQLVGAPPGYVGYDEGGQLTEQVRRNSFSVVLFDEVEKAHPEVFNVMLQIMDDGRLTDGKGRTVDFRNTVIIMTSNIGSNFLAAESMRTAEEFEQASKLVMEALQGNFKPEFLNRVDDIIVFRPLGKEQLIPIRAAPRRPAQSAGRAKDFARTPMRQKKRCSPKATIQHSARVR